MKKTSLLLAAMALSSQLAVANDRGMSTYKVTVTNVSANQVLTPALVVAHNQHFSLFNIGQAASAGLVEQAETGNPATLAMEASDMGATATATGTGLLHPGQSESIMITAPRHAQFSVTSMLAISNDAFIGVKDLSARGHSHAMALVYDAGSEFNNENCAYVPACGETNLRDFDEMTGTAEGIVTVHSGIHGGSDLKPAMADWRGPVASVSVQRMHD